MGWVHYLNKAPSRRLLIAGGTPTWIANSKRRRYIAQVVLSCPDWVDRAAIYALHREAQWMTEITGVQHVVDHEVPLCHPHVCGLSVPWNLRVVPWQVNASKGNDFAPDQLALSFTTC